MTTRTRVIAVLMPNDEATVGATWAGYRVPVREVETLTGYTFFDRLPTGVADALKAEADDNKIPPPRKAARGD